MDVLTKQQRSYNMSRIRSSNTKPEIILRYKLKEFGFCYQPKSFGRPDFANNKTKVAIFLDGCFWHKCPKCYKKPVIRKKFWETKIIQNKKRDRKVNRYLKKEGWNVIRVWEHDVKKSVKDCMEKISKDIGVL